MIFASHKWMGWGSNFEFNRFEIGGMVTKFEWTKFENISKIYFVKGLKLQTSR
jgi:hypothetical protein